MCAFFRRIVQSLNGSLFCHFRLTVFLIIDTVRGNKNFIGRVYEFIYEIDAIENWMVHKIASIFGTGNSAITTKGRERVRHRENLHVGFS